MNLLDYIKAITNKEEINDFKNYSQYALNTYYSKFKCNVFIIESINDKILSDKEHFEYLKINIRPNYNKSYKLSSESNEIVDLLSKHFKVNIKNAKEYLKFLNSKEIKDIKEYYTTEQQI